MITMIATAAPTSHFILAVMHPWSSAAGTATADLEVRRFSRELPLFFDEDDFLDDEDLLLAMGAGASSSEE